MYKCTSSFYISSVCRLHFLRINSNGQIFASTNLDCVNGICSDNAKRDCKQDRIFKHSFGWGGGAENPSVQMDDLTKFLLNAMNSLQIWLFSGARSHAWTKRFKNPLRKNLCFTSVDALTRKALNVYSVTLYFETWHSCDTFFLKEKHVVCWLGSENQSAQGTKFLMGYVCHPFGKNKEPY